MSQYEPVELTQDPEPTDAEQVLNDTIEKDQIPQNPSEKPPGRKFLPRKRKSDQEELLEDYIPLNLKIPDALDRNRTVGLSNALSLYWIGNQNYLLDLRMCLRINKMNH
jgi:hypothetical protein